MSDVASWLKDLGLSEYAKNFAENGVDFAVLPDLTDQDLKELGVLLGHRRKILRAISKLNHYPPAVSNAALPPRDDPERRQLTIMFCDLVRSTAISNRLDPEDMHEVIRAYQEACARVISYYDGFLAKYMGDGVLVYFGYPQAHEDDAERAVRAGLDMVTSIGKLKTPDDVLLKARVGIATGMVVAGEIVGEGVAQERSVLGDTPNLASRPQALAEPATVVVSASTRRLLGDLFQTRDLGPIEIKGLIEPTNAWAIEGAVASESCFEAVRPTRLASFVGREMAINLLLARQRQAWQARVRWCLSREKQGLGSRALSRHSASALLAAHISGCGTSVRLIIVIARSIPSLANWKEVPGSNPMIPLKIASISSKP